MFQQMLKECCSICGSAQFVDTDKYGRRVVCISGHDTEPKIYIQPIRQRGGRMGRPPNQINTIPYDYRVVRTPRSGTDSYGGKNL